MMKIIKRVLLILSKNPIHPCKNGINNERRRMFRKKFFISNAL